MVNPFKNRYDGGTELFRKKKIGKSYSDLRITHSGEIWGFFSKS